MFVGLMTVGGYFIAFPLPHFFKKSSIEIEYKILNFSSDNRSLFFLSAKCKWICSSLRKYKSIEEKEFFFLVIME